jgi:long-chain acyl-CoA synthetase
MREDMARALKDLMTDSIRNHADRVAIRVLREGPAGLEYQPMTFRELGERRARLAAGLHGLGITKGRRVGILTDGGEEPLLIFLATDYLGLSAVPLCLKVPPEILLHSINHSGLEVLFVDQKGCAQYERVRELVANRPRLVLIQGESPSAADDALTWDELLELGAGQDPPDVEVSPEDETKILYTSGSSGLPKGVVQTNANIVANLDEVWDVISTRADMRFFKSAPDYHSLGILNIYFPLTKGWTLDLASTPERVLADLRLSAPMGFLTVPLVLDKVYGNVRKEIDKGGIKGVLVKRAVEVKRRVTLGRSSLGDRLFHAALGTRIIAKIKSQLATRVGANLELLIVGAAKADPEALDFFQDVLDIATFEGYGTTECAPLVAVNTLTGRKTGTVGRPLIEVRIVGPGEHELGYGYPESGEYRSSEGRAGELWVHGPNVMRGYLGDPDETAQVLVEDEDGKVWYRTGDLFSLDEEGFLSFRGRVGRQFKLRNGEFVNPEVLEGVFGRVPLVEHVLVHGDYRRSNPLPLVTVNLEEVRKVQGVPDLPLDDEAALRVHPGLADHIRDLMLTEADRVGLPAHDRPQRVLLLPQPLSEEAGTLTKGLKKIIPGVVVELYREQIEAAYQELDH